MAILPRRRHGCAPWSRGPGLDFSALAEPTRRAIVGRLSRGEATMGELAEQPLDLAETWIHDHRAFWIATLDRLEQTLTEEQP